MATRDWRQITLGDFVTLQRGHDLPEPERNPGDVPVLGSFGITGYHDEAKAEGPGVTVGRSGASFGVVSYTPIDYWPLNTALYVVDFHGNDERFAYYFLKSINFKRYNSGSAQPSLNRNYIHPIPIEVPELGEQRAIAHVLGTLDDKIELNCRMNATLEAIARAIFKSWFVDFDPVHAKARGEQPSGMEAETAALFPDAFEESELGLIPAGWNLINLGDLVSLDKGVSYKGAFLADAGMPMINLGCFLGDGYLELEKLKFYKGDFKERHIVRAGDVVLANTDVTQKRLVLGSPGIVQPRDGVTEFLFTHHVYALRFAQSKDNWRRFVYYSLLQPVFRERAEGFATGTTVLALPRDAVSEYVFFAPPPALIDAFNKTVEPLRKSSFNNQEQSRSLAELRDTLLPKLISGKIRVDTFEASPEETEHEQPY